MARITKSRLPEWAQTLVPRDEHGSDIDGLELADWFLTVEQGRQVGLAEAGVDRTSILARLDAIGNMVGELVAREAPAAARVARSDSTSVRSEPWDVLPPVDAEPPDEGLVSMISSMGIDWRPGEIVADTDDILVLPEPALRAVVDFVTAQAPGNREALGAALRQARGWLPGNAAEGMGQRKAQPWRDLPSREPFGAILNNLRRLSLVPQAADPLKGMVGADGNPA